VSSERIHSAKLIAMDEPIPPRPRPGPAPGAEPFSAPEPVADPPPSGVSRRWLLGGGAAVLVGAGAGVGAEFLRHRSPTPLPPAPSALTAAAAAERALIADLTATTGGSAEVRAVITRARANHTAHLAALDALLTAYRRPAPAASPRPGTPRSRAQLRAAESAAATAAAGRADTLAGAQAALLASIAACEATHAELLR
jgi:hypothetical protein